MRLFLVRHGQTAWNAAMRAQGHSDIPLDATGEQQAARLAVAARDLEIDRVLSSDLERAKGTAQAVSTALRVPFDTNHALRERSFGEFEGLAFSEVKDRMEAIRIESGADPFDVQPPGGESIRMVWDRLGPVLEVLRAEKANLMVVSHGASCSLLLARLVRGTMETSRSFRFGNTAVTELHRRPDGTFEIVRYNDASHLEAERPLSGALDGASR